MIRIVQAQLRELEEAAQLFDRYRQFYRQERDVEGARRFLQERLERDESIVFLAYSEDRAAGFMQLYPSFSSVSMRRLWILNDLFVSPEQRKRGVGEALLVRARQLAIETGAKGVTLSTAVDNAGAQRLYERFGFVREGEFMQYFLGV